MINKLLPKILAIITRSPRYKPKISWSDKSWTHNIFRVYELIFWRKCGIRPEMRTFFEGERVHYEIYSFEALCAHLETYIRNTLKLKPLKITQLRLASSPYQTIFPMVSFAIALDTASNGTATGTSPLTWSHTCTGSDRFLYVGTGTKSETTTVCNVTAVTYNAISTTKARSDTNAPGTSSQSSVWFLATPATGANTVSVAFSGGVATSVNAGAVSYTGAQSTSTADAVNGTNGTTTGAKSFNVTTVADNCWVVATMGMRDGGTGTITCTQTQRWNTTIAIGHVAGEDTNAPKTPAGVQAMGFTIGVTVNTWAMTGASFAPATGGATVNSDFFFFM